MSSDLSRAAETAAIIGAAIGLRPSADPRLREQSLGTLEGRGYADAAEAVAGLDLADPDVRPGGGESLREVYSRMAAVLDEHRGGCAILVSHGDAMRIGMGAWSGVEPRDVPWRTVVSGAVYLLSPGGAISPLPRAGRERESAAAGDCGLDGGSDHDGRGERDGGADLDHGAEHVS